MNKIHISYEQMQGYVLNIIGQLNEDNWRPDYVVGITRGGLLPATLISQYLNIPMYTIKVSLRDKYDCESNGWLSEEVYGTFLYDDGYKTHDPEQSRPDDIPTEYIQRTVLIVDDINDTGATIDWIKNDWMSGCMPNNNKWNDIWHCNVRFAVVVNNIVSDQNVDYFGCEINKKEDPSWIVFPWENFWANKP